MQEGIFSRRLTEQRKLKKISQKQAAKELGISQALLSHYENGVRECGLSFVVKAARYYGVSCDYMLGNSNSTIQIEEQRQIADVPEDKEMSANTIVRAAITAGARMKKDPEMMKYLLGIYGLATYFTLYGGIKKGILPQNWLSEPALNPDRVTYLSATFTSSIRSLHWGDSGPYSEHVPACVSTIDSWTNDYLNISIANLL